MIQTKNYSFLYDQEHDDLLVKLNNDSPIYSDEVCNNLYLLRRESDEEIVGVEILYFMSRSVAALEKYIPDQLYSIITELRREEMEKLQNYSNQAVAMTQTC